MSKNNTDFEKIKGAETGSRLGALILDILIIYAIYGLAVFCISIMTGFKNMMLAVLNPEFGATYMPFKFVLILLPIIWFMYSSILEGGKKESTWGKRITKLRVVYINAGKAKAFDIIVRNIVKVFPILIYSLFSDIAIVSYFAKALMIVYFIVPLCNKNQRGIHDFICATTVSEKTEVETIRRKVSIPQIYIKLPSVEEVIAMREANKREEKVKKAEMAETPIYTVRKLHCTSGVYKGLELLLDGNIIMGKNGEGCNLFFTCDTEGVDRWHCRIEVDDGIITVVDLGSAYGTYVNGMLIRTGEKRRLSVADRIKLGNKEEFVII